MNARTSFSAADRLASFETRKAEIVRLGKEGVSVAEIAYRVGCSSVTVSGVLKMDGVTPRQRTAKRIAPPSLRDYEVPKWVLPQHVFTFHRVAQDEGEEEAASVCRRLKAAEMRL